MTTWCVEEDEPFGATRTFNVGQAAWPKHDWFTVWYGDVARCTSCSGPLTAMLSSCAHAKAVARHVAKETSVKDEKSEKKKRRGYREGDFAALADAIMHPTKKVDPRKERMLAMNQSFAAAYGTKKKAKKPTKKPKADVSITGPISDDPVNRHVEAAKNLLHNWKSVAPHNRYERIECAIDELRAAFRALPQPGQTKEG